LPQRYIKNFIEIFQDVTSSYVRA